MLRLKTGYYQDATPTKNISSVTQNITSPAMKYWHDELTTKEESTRNLYEENFAEFLQFVNKNSDELIVQRQQDRLSKDIKIQRRIESQFLAFITKKKKEKKYEAKLVFAAKLVSLFLIAFS